MKHSINFRSIVISKGIYKNASFRLTKESKKTNKGHTLTKSMKK